MRKRPFMIAAFVALALGGPAPARAGSDGDVVLGAANFSGSTTTMENHSTTNTPLRISATYGLALEIGSGADALDVHGSGYGLRARSNDSISPGVIGWATGNSTGVLGYSDYSYANPGALPTAPANTGVFGTASQDATAKGVWGASALGTGVYASSTGGTALKVVGKASLNRSGKVNVAAGRNYVDVTVTGGLSGTPLAYANLMYPRSGTFVTAVRPNFPSSGKLRIYLSRAVTASTPVSWLVLN